MGKLTIGCFASLVGSTNLDFAVKLSGAALEKGHKVNLRFSRNVVSISIEKQRSFKDYSSLEKPLLELMEKGLNVTACEACAEARGFHDDNTLAGVKRFSMDWYLGSTFDADRVLHIGGE